MAKPRKKKSVRGKEDPGKTCASQRTSISGRVLRTLPGNVDITINTNCPDKWILIDLETLGAVYQAECSVLHHIRLRPISRERYEELRKTCAWIKRKVLDKLEAEPAEGG